MLDSCRGTRNFMAYSSGKSSSVWSERSAYAEMRLVLFLLTFKLSEHSDGMLLLGTLSEFAISKFNFSIQHMNELFFFPADFNAMEW